MGYYVQTTGSNFRLPKSRFVEAHKAMCDLNTTKDSEKTGGAWDGGKQTARWFAWMPKDYPETCLTAPSILKELGFELYFDDDGDITNMEYDNKMGSEDLFLTAIAPFITDGSYINWRGEDGDEYQHLFKDGVMRILVGTTTYSEGSAS